MVAPLAAAADPSPSPAERWFRGAWEAAEHLPDVRHVRLDFSVSPRSMSAEEAQKLRAEVSGRPDHPEAQALKQFDFERKYGRARSSYSVWYRGDDGFRYNETLINHADGDYFVDRVVTPAGGWQLTPNQLGVFASGSSREVSTRSAVSPTVVECYSLLLTMGLHTLRKGEYEIVSFSSEGTAWRAELKSKNGSCWPVRAAGTYNPSVVNGVRVDRIQYFPPADAGAVQDIVHVLSDYREVAEFGLVPRRVASTYSNGSEGILEFEGFVEEPVGRWEELVQVPSLNRPDIIRGQLTIKSILDGEERTVYRSDRRPSLDSAELPPSITGRRVVSVWVWIMFGVCTACVLAWVFGRSKGV